MLTLDRPTPVPQPLPHQHGRMVVSWTIVALLYRTAGFAAWQVLFALLAALLGFAQPWEAAVPWWPLTGALTSIVGLALLAWLFRREGASLVDLYRIQRQTWRGDLAAAAGLLLLAGRVSYLPAVATAGWLFGDLSVA